MDIIYKALGALALFLLGVTVSAIAVLARGRRAAETRATAAESAARVAAAEVEEAFAEKEVERVKALTDDEADREAHAAGVLSDRSPRKRG